LILFSPILANGLIARSIIIAKVKLTKINKNNLTTGLLYLQECQYSTAFREYKDWIKLNIQMKKLKKGCGGA